MSISAILKEFLQNPPAVFLFYPGDDLYPVIERWFLYDLEYGAASSCFRIFGPKDDPRYPGKDNGPGAHGTRFDRHIEGQVMEAPPPQLHGRLSDCEDLGVGRGIIEGLPHVAAPCDDLIAQRRDRPYRDVPSCSGQCCFSQGAVHKGFMK